MSSLAEDFDTFWAIFPRKTGKLDAIRAYAKARGLDSAANILAGVERYKRNKPAYADWCHPSTFLSKGRWMDEDDAPVSVPAKEYWSDECERLHGGQCPKQWTHVMKMRESA